MCIVYLDGTGHFWSALGCIKQAVVSGMRNNIKNTICSAALRYTHPGLRAEKHSVLLAQVEASDLAAIVLRMCRYSSTYEI